MVCPLQGRDVWWTRWDGPVLLHPFLLRPSVLKPDLNDPHVEACFGAQALPHQPRWLHALQIGAPQNLQLASGDRSSWSLTSAIQVNLLRKQHNRRQLVYTRSLSVCLFVCLYLLYIICAFPCICVFRLHACFFCPGVSSACLFRSSFFLLVSSICVCMSSACLVTSDYMSVFCLFVYVCLLVSL